MEASYGREIHRVSEASLTYYTTKRDVSRKKFLSYTPLWKTPSLSSPFGKLLPYPTPLEKGVRGDLKMMIFISYKISLGPSLPKRGNKRGALPKRGNCHTDDRDHY
jgi:hypothetical protein